MSAEPTREPGDDAFDEERDARAEADWRAWRERPGDRLTAELRPAPPPLRPSTVNLDRCQSPIEAAMLMALLDRGFTCDPADPQGLGRLYNQYPIATYALGRLHADAAVVREVGRLAVRIAIELDGHEFHQQTKEQVERDYRRVHALTRAGWIVLRFTGSHVVRDAPACAQVVADVLIEAVARIEAEMAAR